jgi:PAS domain S-box-containing protein
MTGKDNRPEQAANLRTRAETAFREKIAQSPESDPATPEQAQEMLHELRVHQIELEMQNEELRRAESDLNAQRARYFDLYDLAPVGYVTVGESGLIREANLTAATLLGVSRGHLVKLPLSQFILAEDQDAYYLRRKQLMKTGDLQVFELRLVKKGGTAFWAHLQATIAEDEGGTPAIRIVMSDITDRKQAEAYREMGLEVLRILNEPGELRESVRRVLAVLKTRSGFDAVGIRLQDGDDFPYFAQEGFSKEFLLTGNSLVERGANGGICRDKDGKVCLECTCGLVISGKTDPLFTSGGSFCTNDSSPLLRIPPGQDPRHNPRNQCIHQGYASVALVPIRNRDEIVGLIQFNDRRTGRFALGMVELLEGIASHIGAALMRKRAEEALRASESEFRTLAEAMPQIVWITRPDGWNIFFNQQWMDYTGLSLEESLGEGWNKPFHPDDRQGAWAAWKKATLENCTYSIESRLRRADGAYRWWLVRGVPMLDAAGNIIKWYGTCTDINDLKMAEKGREDIQMQLRQSQKMEAVGALAGGVAHDFNNLLSVILSYSSFGLEDVRKDDPLRGDLIEIHKAAERAARLTAQLLAFSRKQVLKPEPLDLNRAVAGMEEMLQRIVGEDIELTQMPSSNLGVVLADRGQIEQVIMNLVVNARDAMPRGGKLSIETANVELDEGYAAEHVEVKPGSYVMLAVSDTGSGMDAQTRGRIFEPFFTTKGPQKGTGLGLSTVYGIVKQSGGNIWVYSEPGQGTTFKIYLPRERGAAAVASGPPSSVARIAGTETILVVEDEPALGAVAKRILGAAGYTVLVAENGGEALLICEGHEGEIHLVLTDVVMPRMSGKVFAERLAKVRPKIKVIYMSGYTADAIGNHGVLDAGTEFIGKPFNAVELARKVREVLDAPARP